MTRPDLLRLAAAIAGGLALGLATAGHAQDAAPPAAPAGPDGPHAGRGWDPAQARARMDATRQRRMQTLHDALGLRPDQEGAWQAFVAGAASDQRGGEWRERSADAEAPLTTPERLDRMARRLDQMKARLERRAAAVRRLYAALDPRQQKTFDALLALRPHGRMGERPGGPWRG